MTNRKIEYWVIPPKGNGAFVAVMENILETYKTPHNKGCPVICMVEQPVQLWATRGADAGNTQTF